MENNSILPVSYETLTKKIKRVKFILLICSLIAIAVPLYFSFTFYKGLWVLIIPCLGYVIWLGEILANGFFKKMMKEMATIHNWVLDENFKINPWNFMEYLEEEDIHIIPAFFSRNIACFMLYGKSYNRDFFFYKLTARYGKNDKEEFVVIKTDPIANFNNVILIRSYEVESSDEEIPNKLQEVKIDTKGLLHIYAKDTAFISDFLNQDFLNALIKYLETTGEAFSILITPQGILITKALEPATSPSLFFGAVDKYVSEYWQSTENFIKLLDLINLLEKK